MPARGRKEGLHIVVFPCTHGYYQTGPTLYALFSGNSLVEWFETAIGCLRIYCCGNAGRKRPGRHSIYVNILKILGAGESDEWVWEDTGE